RLAVLDAQLRAADPAVQLARGYSITFDDRGEVVRSVQATPPGARIRTRLADGELVSRVDARTASTEMRSAEGGAGGKDDRDTDGADTHGRERRG
ncbi:MAG: exodeoxyribonuclease VII large subunit, partial [Nitriliruptoraceae bacterium]